jgi:hypothetical protein
MIKSVPSTELPHSLLSAAKRKEEKWQLPALALGPAHKSAKSPLVLFPRRAACFRKHNQQLWPELLLSESIEPYGTSSKEACGLNQHLVHY